MITWCEKCGTKPAKHRAKCNFCPKESHPICDDCYKDGIEDGTIKATEQKGILARIFG